MGSNVKESKIISAVIYLRNHEKHIAGFLEGLAGILSENFENFEFILVNDNSADSSVEICKNTASRLGVISFTLVNLSHYHGTEAAITAGVDISIGDFIFEFDSPVADYDFKEIINVYKFALEGYDIVSASPDGKERISSKFFYHLFRKYSRNHIKLRTERFRILSRRAVNRINMYGTSIQYRKAVYYNIGLKAYIHKYLPNKITGQEGQMDTMDRLVLAVNSLLLFTNILEKMALYMALIMLVFSISVLGYTVFIFLVYDRVVEGWTTIMLFLSISFTGLFTLLAILIKFVSLILNLQNKKQAYTYESVEKIRDA